MWRYLIFNGLWFSLLFLVHFGRSEALKKLTLVSIFALFVYSATQGRIDPFAGLFYLVFSLVVFYSASRFRYWSLQGSLALDVELGSLSKELETARQPLAHSTRETELLGRKADEIAELYEEVSQMSKSLDVLETLLVFGKALAGNFEFNVIKLAVFGEENPHADHPVQIYELGYSDLRQLFDRSVFLKDRSRAQGEMFPFDRNIYRVIFREPGPYQAAEPPVMARPIFIHSKIYAILTLVGIRVKDAPILDILVERFVAELQRVELYRKVETLATLDGLTGVYVRRHLAERLEGEVDRAERFGFKLSFLMIDIDAFKSFNDEYGHLVGDVVLKQTAETIKGSVREVDLVGRYGGEEFGVLLVETDEPGALRVAERIRQSVEAKTFKAYDENLRVTISIGCATYSRTLHTVGSIVDAADAALYQAKRQGKNRVRVTAAEVSE